MPAGDFLVGLAYLLPTLVATFAGAWLLLTRRFGGLTGTPRLLAFSVLAVCGLLATHLAPAILGLLSRPSVLAAALLWLLATALVPVADEAASHHAPVRTPEPGPPSGAAAGWLSAIAALLVALLALAIARDQLFLAPRSADLLNFHLPGVVAWMQSGSIWQIDVFLSDVALGHFPNNGDVILLAVVLPWSNDFLAHLAMYPFYVLTGIAAYAIAAELRAPGPAALAAGCLVCAIPSVIVSALTTGLVDSLMLFAFATGALFLLRHARSGSTGELVLAGLALGIAFGTKWYGVSAVAIALAVWAAASLLAGRRPPTVLRQGLALTALVAVAGGIWMVRNWVESGNPVFPVRLAPLGVQIFDAPRDVVRERGGFTVAGYLDDPRVWVDYILPQLRDALAFGSMVLVAGLVATFGVIGSRRGRGAARPVAVAALLTLLAYAIIPYTAGGPEGRAFLTGANARYAVPALLLAAPSAAWLAGRFRHGPEVLAVAAVIAAVDAMVQVSDQAVSAATIDRNDWLAAIGFLVAVTALALALPPLWSRLSRGTRRASVPVAIALALVAVTIGGYEMQKRYNGIRYYAADPTIDYVLTRAGEGQRIALAGVWDNGIPPVLPAFGPRYGNQVAYVGRDEGGFLRRFGRRGEFLAALRSGDYDYLFVGHGIPRRQRLIEEAWALSAGWRTVARSARLTLLQAPASAAGSAASDREDVVAEEQPQRP